MPGVFATCLRTEKFQTGVLSLHLLTALDRQTAAMNAMLPDVLRRGTVRAPDLAALAAQLERLQGARIEPSVRKLGEIQCLGFVVDVPEDGAGLAGIASLLGELLLAPNTRGGLLLPQYVEDAKQKLLAQIRAKLDNSAAYAQMRLTELMCPGETYGVNVLGDEETAEDIDYVPLTRHYRSLLSTAPMEIFYCGSDDPEQVCATMTEALLPLPRGEIDLDIGTDIRLNTVEEQPRRFDEELDGSPGTLVIGYRLGEAMEQPDMAALRVLNALYGGAQPRDPAAKGQAPSAPGCRVCSALDLTKGIMTVTGDVDPADYETVLAALDRRLLALKNGDFTHEALQAARLAVSDAALALTDDPTALEKFWLEQNLLGLDYDPEELAALAELVTKEDVVTAAAGIGCDAVYFRSANSSAAHI